MLFRKALCRDVDNTPEQVEVLPIEVPFSPPGNGQLPHFTMECNLPGTPTTSDGTLRHNAVETITAISTSENDVASAEIELSETSSNVSAESNLLLLGKPENNRSSVKKKKFLNAHSGQLDVELRVIHNGSIFDEDSGNINQTASC